MNRIKNCFPSEDKNTLSMTYVDDLAIILRSKSQRKAEFSIQSHINKVHAWAESIGMKFSTSKTVCVHFNQKRQPPAPSLTLGNVPITVQRSVKFLGVTFDEKLTFRNHILATRIKCLKAINLLKFVSGKGHGCDRKTKLSFYKAPIRSKLDYGCEAYSSARKTDLALLQTVQTQGLRIALNAFRTSPIKYLQIHSGEIPIRLRHLLLTMKYFIRIHGNKSNPARKDLSPDKYDALTQRKRLAIHPFKQRLRPHFIKLGNTLALCDSFTNPFLLGSDRERIPPWRMKIPEINLSLTYLNKECTPHKHIQQAFLSIKHDYMDSIFVYTDGSKTQNGTAAGISLRGTRLGFRITAQASIFTAEAFAVLEAIKYCRLLYPSENITVCTDSLSVLKSLSHPHCKTRIISYIMHTITSADIRISFIWIPSHTGIRGNDIADTTARDAIANDNCHMDLLIPSSDFGPLIKKYVSDLWRSGWSNRMTQQQHLSDQRDKLKLETRDDSMLTRMMIGHTYLSHGHFLRQEPLSICQTCNCRITLPHKLFYCPELETERIRTLGASTVPTDTLASNPLGVLTLVRTTNLKDII